MNFNESGVLDTILSQEALLTRLILGLRQIQVTSVEDAMKLLMLGDRNRCFAFTKLVHTILSLKATFAKILFNSLKFKKKQCSCCACGLQNAHSSRSHTIVILTVEKKVKYQTAEQKSGSAERRRISSCFLESERYCSETERISLQQTLFWAEPLHRETQDM